MRKQINHVLIILFVLLSVPAGLHAKGIYIKAISLKYEKDLLYIRSRLNDLGYNMHFAYKNRRYHVYTGPFKNRATAKRALGRIQKYISNDALIVGDSSVVQQQKSEKEMPLTEQAELSIPSDTGEQNATITLMPEPVTVPEEIAVPVAGTFFMALSVGFSSVNVSQNDKTGTLVLDTQPGDRGMTYGLEGGYSVSENLFVTLNYGRAELDDATFDHLFSTLNYKFDKRFKTSPYIGVLLGYSMMSWKTSPIASPYNDWRGSSFFGGAQMGAEFSVTDRVSLALFYRFMLMDQSTQIKTPSAEAALEHTFEHAVNMGVKYRF